MLTVKALKEQKAEMEDKILAIVTSAKKDERENTPEELAEIDLLQGVGDSKGKIGEVQTALDRAIRVEETQKQIALSRVKPDFTPDGQIKLPETKIVIPSSQIRGNLKAFKGDNAMEDAFVCGQWAAATLGNNSHARDWCKNHGIDIQNAMSTDSNTAGGFTVPDPLESTVIRLVEEYGVFRRNIGRVWPMPNGSLKVPKRNGGFTTYYVGENTAITASDVAFAQVSLQANKLAALTQISNELFEDTAVALGDILAQEFAYAFAVAEDAAGFLGDGTSTYGGIQGLANALAAGAVETTASGVDTFDELTIATFHNAQAKLARYPGIMPKWYISQVGYETSMKRLAFAAGGNTVENFAGGMALSFMGFPVEISQTLPGTSGTTDHSDVRFGYFGDLSMAAAMGDSRGMTVRSDPSVYFTQDALAICATERYDITVHDIGTATLAGAVVGMHFNAS